MSNLLLLEVMDKELGLTELWATFIGLGLLSMALARFKRWLGLVILPVIAFFALGQLAELHDLSVGPAIVQEAGQGYVTQSYIAIGIGVLLTITSPFLFRVSVGMGLR